MAGRATLTAVASRRATNDPMMAARSDKRLRRSGIDLLRGFDQAPGALSERDRLAPCTLGIIVTPVARASRRLSSPGHPTPGSPIERYEPCPRDAGLASDSSCAGHSGARVG